MIVEDRISGSDGEGGPSHGRTSRSRPWPGALAACAAGLALACASGSAREDAAGQARWPVRAYGDSAPATWRLEERLRVESPDNAPFAGVSVGPRGRMYAWSRREETVRVYRPDGRPLRTLGGESGASRLEDVRGLAWEDAGHLWIVEGRRFAVFDTAGRFVREVPRVSRANGDPWGGAGFDRRGRLLDMAYGPGGGNHPVLLRLARDGSVLDTIRLPYLAPRELSPGSSRRMAGRPVGADTGAAPGGRRPRAAAIARAGHPFPHSPAATWAFDPDGHMWVARTDRYRIHRRTLEGDTVLEIDREAARPRPGLASLSVDADGRLWVRLAADRNEPATYDVFSRDGAYLARVETGVGVRAAPPVIHGRDVYYVGFPPGGWPPPEPGDLTRDTDFLVRARLVPSPRGRGS